MKPPPLPLSVPARQARAGFVLAAVFFAGFLLWKPAGLVGPAAGFCVFRQLTGLPCGLCGGTRALRAAAQGDFALAGYYNALALPVAACGAVFAGVLLAEAIRGRRILPSPPVRIRVACAVLAVVAMLAWSFAHAANALACGKDELCDPSHPVALFVRALVPAGGG